MRKISLLIFSFLFLFLFPRTADAEISVRQDPTPLHTNSGSVKFTFTSDVDFFLPNEDYTFALWGPDKDPNNIDIGRIMSNSVRTPNSNKKTLIYSYPIEGDLARVGTWAYRLALGRGFPALKNSKVFEGSYRIYAPGGNPSIKLDSGAFQAHTNIPVYLLNAQPNQNYTLWFDGDKTYLLGRVIQPSEVGQTKYGNGAEVSINTGDPFAFPKALCLTQSDARFGTVGLTCDFLVKVLITPGPPPSGSPVESGEVGYPSPAPTARPPSGPCEKGFCPTAFGDILIKPADFVTRIFGILLSLAGGIALILIMISGYRLMASGGNPEKVQAAREQLTSAIIGLLFIIFSLSILQIIGVDILKIPGLTK